MSVVRDFLDAQSRTFVHDTGFTESKALLAHMVDEFGVGPSYWDTSVRPAMELTQFAVRAAATGGASVGTAFFLHTVNVLDQYFEYLRMRAS